MGITTPIEFTNVQPCCERSIHQRLARFDREAGFAIPTRLLTYWLLTNISSEYPDSLEMIGDSHHPVYAVADVLPVYATPAPIQFIMVEVVDAPIRMTGARLKIHCDTCGRSGHLVVMNARFLSLMHHLLYIALQTSRTVSDYKILGERILTAFFPSDETLRSPYETLPMIPTGDWSRLVFNGAAWLVFHEFAHVVEKPILNEDHLPDSFIRKNIACEEVSADVSALRFLQFRLTARNPLDTENKKWLYGGVEIVLRTLMLIHAFAQRDLALRHDSSPQRGPYHPSPYLRLNYVSQFIDTELKLGLLSNNIQVWRDDLRTRWEDMLEACGE
jgi:hypothetical protein